MEVMRTVLSGQKKKHIVILFNVHCFLLDDFTKCDATRIRLAALRINLMTLCYYVTLLRNCPIFLRTIYAMHNPL
jgi:hypothetical protein